MTTKQLHINPHQPFFKWRTFACITMLLVLAGATSRATVETFNASTTWTCPLGVTTVTVECWGGGGAGGSARRSSGSGSATTGGGGAGGVYVMKTNITVTPGNSYAVIVGGGGSPIALPPTDGTHGDGSDSWFSNSVVALALAKGGNGGISKNAASPSGGAGGSCPSGSIGDTINLGGIGATGDGSGQAGGGGAGSGGTLSAGNNGGSPSVQSGATAVSGGGAGGNGRSGGTTGAGTTGSSPGGGGGGASALNTTGALGGTGAAGKVAISYTLPGAAYTWVATSGSADWTIAGSWSPNRTTTATNDVLLFNQSGNSTAVNVPTETDGKLQVSSNTTINLQSGGGTTLTIGETAPDSLTVASGSQLNDNGTSALLIALPLGAKGSISGSITFSNAADTLTAVDGSGITFNSGATFIQNCSGNVFGPNTGTANSIIFASGSTFIQFTGGNPFSRTAPTSVIVFQPGSLFSCRGNTAPSTSGRTYADFECNVTNATLSVTGGSPLIMSNLTVVQNTFTVSMGGGFNLNGSASVASGATLNLNNTVATASGKTITVNGTLGGTATISGSAAFTISSTGTLAPGSSSSIGTFTFATAPTLNGTNFMKIDRNGGSPLADKVVLSSGTLNYGGKLIVTNIGAALQVGDTFTNFSAAAFNSSFSGLQLPSGYTWDTSQLNANGSIKVTAIGSLPTINSITASGTNVALNAIGGTANGSVSILTSTNLTLPIAQWTVATNGNFDNSGNFSCTVTNGFSPNTPQRFYLLQ